MYFWNVIISEKKNKLLDREAAVKCQESSSPGLRPWGPRRDSSQAGRRTPLLPAPLGALHPAVSSPPDVLSVLVFHRSLQYQQAQQQAMPATLVLNWNNHWQLWSIEIKQHTDQESHSRKPHVTKLLPSLTPAHISWIWKKQFFFSKRCFTCSGVELEELTKPQTSPTGNKAEWVLSLCHHLF